VTELATRRGTPENVLGRETLVRGDGGCREWYGVGTYREENERIPTHDRDAESGEVYGVYCNSSTAEYGALAVF